jgi:hypothetical protein
MGFGTKKEVNQMTINEPESKSVADRDKWVLDSVMKILRENFFIQVIIAVQSVDGKSCYLGGVSCDAFKVTVVHQLLDSIALAEETEEQEVKANSLLG